VGNARGHEKRLAQSLLWSRSNMTAAPHRSAFLLAASFSIFVACAGDESSTAGTSEGALVGANIPCDVQKVLATRCQNCHAPDGLKAGAPMPLATQADFARLRGGLPVHAIAKSRINDRSGKPMPPGPAIPESEQALLDDWLGRGAPAGRACEAGAAALPKTFEKPCDADTMLKAKTPYTLRPDKDDQYVCFGVDVDRTAKRHVWAMYPEIDNASVLHHILVFQADKTEDPTPHACDSFGASEWKMMGGWAPGGGPIVLPSEAGYPENQGTTHWVLQLHYNNASRKTDQKDQSGFGVCTTDQLRQYDAGILAFGALRFTIPPRRTHGITCEFGLDERFQGAHFFGASPHMHKLGSALSIDRLFQNKTQTQNVIDAKSYNFEEQTGTKVSIDVSAGDTIRTRCEWKNPGDRAVTFGEGTGAEMCFGFVTYYPAIKDEYTTIAGRPAPVFNWSTPSNNLPIMDTVRKESGLAIPSPTCRED